MCSRFLWCTMLNAMDSCLSTPTKRKRFVEDPGRRNDDAWDAVVVVWMGWLFLGSVLSVMDSCLSTPTKRKRFVEDPGRRNDGAWGAVIVV